MSNYVGPAEMKKSPLPVQNIFGTEKQICGKDSLVKLLRWHFGHSEFRGKQLEAIEAVLSGRDCFCLMPTGGGKSMCYQIPALAKSGIVLVVCPLIALMENQVMALKEKGIAAEYLSSTQMSHIRGKIYEALDAGKPSLRLLYVTPELIVTNGFMSKLTKLYARGLLNLIAIDEAHCISAWGHDFRPSYRKLSSLRNHFKDVPILASTATAVPKVQKDVIESLCLHNPLVLRSSFNRPNIFYEVRYKDIMADAYTDLSNLLKSSGDICSIIYCLERATCDDLSAHLSKNGISCAAYHAGLNNKLRSSVLNDWISSRVQVVVATVAFGGFLVGAPVVHAWLPIHNWCCFRMGIDRKDVRIVCHFNIPKSMEAFYQESGRAGRDQLPSKSLLYYGMDDRRRMEFILSNSENKKLKASKCQDGFSKKSLTDFLQSTVKDLVVEGKKILESFGEQVTVSLCRKSCDACKHPNLLSQQLEELTSASSIRQQNGISHIFMSSSSNLVGDDQYTEFWNRDDEAGDSEEDISDSDDGVEAVKSLARSKFSSKSGMNEKIEFLQRAEENYFQKKVFNKQNSKPTDKNAISEVLRESSKQRLLSALKQTQQRLGSIQIELETSATFLENECYKKYGKTGKTFYYSHVASTVRWLSTSSSEEVSCRLGVNTVENNTCKPDSLPSPSSLSLTSAKDQHQEPIVVRKEIPCSVGMETSLNTVQMKNASENIKLPPIPSFSDFAARNAKESNSNSSSPLKKQPPTGIQKSVEKRLRLQ